MCIKVPLCTTSFFGLLCCLANFCPTKGELKVPFCATILHTSEKIGENKEISQTSQLLQIEKMKKNA